MNVIPEISIDLTAQELTDPETPVAPIEVDDICEFEPLIDPHKVANVEINPADLPPPVAAERASPLSVRAAASALRRHRTAHGREARQAAWRARRVHNRSSFEGKRLWGRS